MLTCFTTNYNLVIGLLLQQITRIKIIYTKMLLLLLLLLLLLIITIVDLSHAVHFHPSQPLTRPYTLTYRSSCLSPKPCCCWPVESWPIPRDVSPTVENWNVRTRTQKYRNLMTSKPTGHLASWTVLHVIQRQRPFVP